MTDSQSDSQTIIATYLRSFSTAQAYLRPIISQTLPENRVERLLRLLEEVERCKELELACKSMLEQETIAKLKKEDTKRASCDRREKTIGKLLDYLNTENTDQSRYYSHPVEFIPERYRPRSLGQNGLDDLLSLVREIQSAGGDLKKIWDDDGPVVPHIPPTRQAEGVTSSVIKIARQKLKGKGGPGESASTQDSLDIEICRGISSSSQDNSVSGSLGSLPLASTPIPRGPMSNSTTNAETPGESVRPSIELSSLKESKAFDSSPGSPEGAFLVTDDGSSLLLFDDGATPYKKSKVGDDYPLWSESGFEEASSMVHGAQSSSKTFLEGSFPLDNQNQDQNQWKNPGHKASNWVPGEDTFNFQICDPEEHSSNADASGLIENAKRRAEAQPGPQDKRRRTFGESAVLKTCENLKSGQSLGDESITRLMQAVIEHKQDCFAGLQLWQFISYVHNVSKSVQRRPPRATACQDHLLIPLMWNHHWVLGYFQRKLSLLRLYNSLGPSELELRKNAQKFFGWYCGKRVDQVIEVPVAQQKNNVDCGVHLIATVLCLVSGVDPGRYMDSVDTSALRIEYANELLSSGKLSLIPASFKDLMAICHSRDMEHQEVVRRHIMADYDYKSSKIMLESLREKMKHLTLKHLTKLEKMIVDAKRWLVEEKDARKIYERFPHMGEEDTGDNSALTAIVNRVSALNECIDDWGREAGETRELRNKMIFYLVYHDMAKQREEALGVRRRAYEICMKSSFDGML